jgi:DedD protein
MAEAPEFNVDELRRRARRRLIGAVVLALAAAVIIPMLLENDPKPLGEDVAVKIPPVDNAKFVNKLSDKGGKTAAPESAPKAEPAKESTKGMSKADVPDAASPDSSAPTNVPAPKKSITLAEQKMLGAVPKPAIAPPPLAPAAATAAKAAAAPPAAVSAANAPAPANADAPKEGFSVQLAAFADDKGANALANKLKKAQYPAYTEPLTTSKGTLWRVRVGPYPTRDEATTQRDKLKADGYSGIVSAAR